MQRKEYVFFIVFQEASPIYTHTWRMETSREDEREDQRAEERCLRGVNLLKREEYFEDTALYLAQR